MKAVRWTGPIVILVAVALVPAAGSRPFGAPVHVVDPAGDNKDAPDLQWLDVRQQGDRVEYGASFTNRVSRLETGEFFVFYVDADADRSTGSSEGFEFLIEFEQEAGKSSVWRVHRWNTTTKKFASDSSFASSFRTDWGLSTGPSLANELHGFFKPGLFGIQTRFNFAARAESAGEGDNYTFDRAPDSGIATLVLDDTTAPAVKALPATAKAGQIAKLGYRVSDASGQSREVVIVKKGTRTLGTVKTKLHPAVSGKTYVAAWKVPATMKGALQFCVQAFDATGNASAQSCAPLRVA